ncbi:MAG: hypothetical protein H7338_09840 [Candidatus Sericytochromatia bacterium]|nr:hypothetical protein [Candidatus Sericytochromatia bacterium]
MSLGSGSVYIGRRTPGCGTEVWRASPAHLGRLNPRLDIARFSRTRFDWGHRLPGSAQLALALLADHSDNPEWALREHGRLLNDLIVNLPYWNWVITAGDIQTAIFCI